jgi:D-3-phosphoglycerate dehydrogenase / 2-oxoglutarate reductase
VVRFNHWISPEFGQRLAQESDLAVTEIDLQADPDLVWQHMAKAHVYQVSAAVNELPEPYRVNEALLARCPDLLCVSSGGAGYDTVDVAACTAAGVAVVNQAGGNSAAVAEMAIGLMLAVSRRIVESDRKLRTQQDFSRESLMGQDLGGKTLGLVGLGHAGSRVAALASAFGMEVLAVDPYLGQSQIRARGAEPVTLDQLIERADIVSVHCPRDKSTVKMFNAERFQRMKAGALFVSTARGGIHDETALYGASLRASSRRRAGRLGGGATAFESSSTSPS